MAEDNEVQSNYNLNHLAGIKNCHGDKCVRNFLSGYDPRVSFSTQLEDAQYDLNPSQWHIGPDKKTCPIDPAILNGHKRGNLVSRTVNKVINALLYN